MIDKKSLLIMFEGDNEIIETTLLNYAMNNGWTIESPESKEDFIAKTLWGVITQGAIEEMFQGDEEQEKIEAQSNMDKVNSYGL